MDDQKIRLLKSGDVFVMPTDTVYGLVASALLEEAVHKIYELKRRELTKPPVVLVGGIEQLSLFGIRPDEFKRVFENHWPGPVSIILPVTDEKWTYLHRGKASVAFRLPDDIELRELLVMTGPLATSSANISHESPAQTLDEAKAYFGDEVRYIDGGRMTGKSSKIIKLQDGEEVIIRP